MSLTRAEQGDFEVDASRDGLVLDNGEGEVDGVSLKESDRVDLEESSELRDLSKVYSTMAT